jgi:hypothetical protein
VKEAGEAFTQQHIVVGEYHPGCRRFSGAVSSV